MTNDRRQMPNDGKISHCLWQGELKTGLLKYFEIPLFHVTAIVILVPEIYGCKLQEKLELLIRIVV